MSGIVIFGIVRFPSDKMAMVHRWINLRLCRKFACEKYDFEANMCRILGNVTGERI